MTVLHPDGASASRTTETAAASRREAVRYHGLYLTLACIVLGLAAFLQINGQDKVIVPGLNLPLPDSCLYRRLVGTGCPGCGLTRCFIALMDGDWGTAWSYNPAGYLVFVLIASQLPYRSVQIFRVLRGRPELRHSMLSAFLACLLVLALMSQWLLRQFYIF